MVGRELAALAWQPRAQSCGEWCWLSVRCMQVYVEVTRDSCALMIRCAGLRVRDINGLDCWLYVHCSTCTHLHSYSRPPDA